MKSDLSSWMRTGISITVTFDDRHRLEGIVRHPNRAQKHIARARTILATAGGFGRNEIMPQSGLAKPNVWRWQERFMHQGVDGLLRDKTRPPGKPPVPEETVRHVLDLTLSEPSGEATHWTVRMMADVNFASKLRDVVGLYIDPPAHAIVDLQTKRFIVESNQNPKPYVWTADPNRIVDAVQRGKHVSETIHPSTMCRAARSVGHRGRTDCGACRS